MQSLVSNVFLTWICNSEILQVTTVTQIYFIISVYHFEVVLG